jgi:peptidoglycan/LPS O-acetylase OafA/YrhL
MEKPRITATAATSDPEDTGQRFSPEHLSSVDALRGIAALTVVCLHVTLVPSPHLGTPNWLRPLVLAGGTGVTMFFVVSAFTLSISWFSRKDGAHPIRNFYIRRLFRIVPLFYCLLAVTFFRDGYYWHVKHSVNEIVINACMVFNLLPQYSTGIVWASWTIGVEMLFYLMFPLVVKAASRVARLVVCFIATLIVALIFYLGVQHTDLPADLRGQYVATGLAMHLPVFVLGIAAYALHRSKLFTQWGSVRVGGILVVMALILHLVSGQVGGGLVGTRMGSPCAGPCDESDVAHSQCRDQVLWAHQLFSLP